ncbi:MAG: Maf family protein [Bythopirellula sp.]|nr:Maf family protein [Bythopirellula sp.]
MSQFSLILASSSPQRKALLAEAGYQFDILPPHDSAESGICSQCGPAELVLDLAVRKAADVVTQLRAAPQSHQPALVLSCDTVAECEGTILGKPRDEDHARAMLEQLRGKRHRVYSGLCLWPWERGKKTAPRSRVDLTELEMDQLTDAAIDEYLDSGLWRGKAGAFGYQDRPGWLRIVKGSESNVIGLPMELLAQMIEQIALAQISIESNAQKPL